MHFDPRRFAMSMFVLVISLTVHEFSHAYAAYLSGDDTAKRAGRLSLNPLDHLDPTGTIMMVISSLVGFGIGWAKPVPINPMRFRHPRWDELKVSAWGPISNLLLAFIAGQVMRFWGAHMGRTDLLILFLFIMINIGLAIFNLIPISPLDGSHIFSALLPVELARQYDMFMARYGFTIMLFFILVAPGALSVVLDPARRYLFTAFTGLPAFF